MWHPDAIERALAHRETNKVRGAYDRAMHWDERTRMMQWWSDYLHQSRGGGKAVPLKAEIRSENIRAIGSTGMFATLAGFLMD